MYGGAALSSGAEKALGSVPPGAACQSAVMLSSAALAWLPSWCDAASSRSSPGPALVHPGANSDAQCLCVLGYPALGSPSQEHVSRGAYLWRCRGNSNLRLR